MANKMLFKSQRGAMSPAANALNSAGASAYAFEPKHELAQFAVTGCLSNTFYCNAESQLSRALELAAQVDAAFIAKTALYARERAAMKDMPALLLAVLSVKDPQLLRKVFARVIDNGRMLRTFVQILRSGIVGRKSLGSAPKALVREWLASASERKLLDAAVGAHPSLKDVVCMVHPKPADRMREAFYAWLLGRDYALDALPVKLQEYLVFKYDRSQPVPDVPFQMLTALGLSRAEWKAIARNAPWQMLRMNLNTFARHGVFESKGMAQCVAEKLGNRAAIRKARALPYQLLAAYVASANGATGGASTVPAEVREALQDAMEIALENVSPYAGRVVVCPDVSGSMSSPVTGHRKGASSAVRCIDVAGLMAAAVLRVNRGALVLPFEQRVRELELNPRDSVMSNARKLASIGGGGTSCSSPLAWMNHRRVKADLVILVSDNESWVDLSRPGATETLRQWNAFKEHNPEAKLVCIDVQPNSTTQARERDDVLNVGGFSDEVFGIVRAFASGELARGHWTAKIEETEF
jgi:60 kDa SS-A/Ro ribonucleoprotein